MDMYSDKGASHWLTVLPMTSQWLSLPKATFRETLCMRSNWQPSVIALLLWASAFGGQRPVLCEQWLLCDAPQPASWFYRQCAAGSLQGCGAWIVSATRQWRAASLLLLVMYFPWQERPENVWDKINRFLRIGLLECFLLFLSPNNHFDYYILIKFLVQNALRVS